MSERTDENTPTHDEQAPQDPQQAPQASEQQGETLGAPAPESGAVRDPEHWVTGDEPMTGPQRSYLDNLARQAGEEIPADLNKAQASEHIDRLQQKVDGAGTTSGDGAQR